MPCLIQDLLDELVDGFLGILDELLYEICDETFWASWLLWDEILDDILGLLYELVDELLGEMLSLLDELLYEILDEIVGLLYDHLDGIVGLLYELFDEIVKGSWASWVSSCVKSCMRYLGRLDELLYEILEGI